MTDLELVRLMRRAAKRGSARRATMADVLAYSLALACGAIMLAGFCRSCEAHAQIHRADSDVEVLARIAVHETGWEDTGDIEAIFAVLQSGAEREGITWREYARRYSRRLHAGEVSRRWASQLTESCERPESWPRTVSAVPVLQPHVPWSAYHERCEAVMRRARETLAGERTDGCEERPEDWGGRVDRARARRLGLRLIDCSLGDVETVGDYYRRD